MIRFSLIAALCLFLIGCEQPVSIKTVTDTVTENPTHVGDTVAGGFTVTAIDSTGSGYIAERDLGLNWYSASQTDYANRLVASTTTLPSGILQYTSATTHDNTTLATTWQGSSSSAGTRVVTATQAALANVKLDSYYGYAAALVVKACYSSGSETAAPPVTTKLDLEATKSFYGLFRHEAIIAGTWTKDVTLTADKEWTLNGPVFIGKDNSSNSTITIEAGTIVKGTSSSIAPGMLVITRGSKIMAEGTSSAPIIFTSAKSIGSRAPGDWGGLVINGNAPVNDGGTTGVDSGEGATGNYGGSDPHDNSGVLKYVRSEFAGVRFTADNELNGIAFQGVGDGTTVDYIQAHRSNDDGVEFFGGTVNVRHLVSTGNLDDHFDWTSGYRGSLQFAVLQEYPLNGSDCGFEGDGKENNSTATPFSHPVIANITAIGSGIASTNGLASPDFNGTNFRRGTKVDLYNSVFANYKNAFRETDSSGSAWYDANTSAASGITYKGVIANATNLAPSNGTGNYGVFTNDYYTATGKLTSFVSGTDGNYFGSSATGNTANLPSGYIAALTTKSGAQQYDTWTFAFKPTAAASSGIAQTLPANATTTDYTVTSASKNGTFTATGYIGAVDPAGADWTTGWTTNAAN